MKVTAGIAIAAFLVALALPAMLFAQEPAPVDPAPADPAPAEPAPVEPVEPAPPDDAAQPAPPEAAASGAETTTATPVVAKGSGSVSMVDYAFSPATITINPGDSVTWTNTGEEDHDASGSGFSTGNVVPGSSGSASFSTPGTFNYICSIHPNMKGTVIVSDTGGTGGTDSGGGDGTVDPETGLPVTGEEAAGLSADAAGSADALPASGETEAPLVILGMGLLACGMMASILARWRAREGEFLP